MENIEEKDLYNIIGKNIKRKRKELNITQDKLAQITNYSPSFIANIESNTYQSFSISALFNIATALKTTMADLIDNTYSNVCKYKIDCKLCDYELEIPLELKKIINLIEEINFTNIIFTCPHCNNKISITKKM